MKKNPSNKELLRYGRLVNHKFRPCQSRIVLSLQYLKLKGKSHESAQDWMGRLHTMPAECYYKEYERKLTEQFIHGLDDKGMISEILREASVLEDINCATSEWVL